MLFLVISSPRPEQPSTVSATRSRFWGWMQPMIDSGQCKSIHARVGRGVVALFDVDSNLTLHRIMNEWAEFIPAEFDVYPLLDPTQAQAYLQSQQTKN